MKYFFLGIFLLIVAWDIFIYLRTRKRRNQKDLTDSIPPVFEVKENYIPINSNYDIIISDFIELLYFFPYFLFAVLPLQKEKLPG